MRITSLATSLFLGLALASCTENKPPASAQPEMPVTKSKSFAQSMQEANIQYSSNVAPNQMGPAQHRDLNLSGMTLNNVPTATPADPAVSVPADARWTLYCASVSGPDRV